MFEHSKKFKHKEQSIVLLLDDILFSLDDKGDEDFVIDTIFDKNINKTLYFVASFVNYNEFKKNYPKAKISAFWHSLFINNKIDLSKHKKYQLKTNDSIYTLSYNLKNEISVSFKLLSQLKNKQIDHQPIDININKFIQIVSPAEKAQKARLEKNYKISGIAFFWFLLAVSIYIYIDNDKKQEFDTTSKILILKTKISAAENKIISQNQKIYAANKTVVANIKSLLFLQFKSIQLIGEITLKDQSFKIKSTADLELLHSFVGKYKEYKLTRHPEALPTLGIHND